MRAFERDARARGAEVALESRSVGGDGRRRRASCCAIGGPDPTTVACRAVVNAAGPVAQEVARADRGNSAGEHPALPLRKGALLRARRRLARSAASSIRSRSPGASACTSRWISAGRRASGPTSPGSTDVDYSFDETRGAVVLRGHPPLLARTCQTAPCSPGYTGIRPKLGPAGSPAGDFVIQGPAEHGVPGLVNLYGIESPGLTASLAIADCVSQALGL